MKYFQGPRQNSGSAEVKRVLEVLESDTKDAIHNGCLHLGRGECQPKADSCGQLGRGSAKCGCRNSKKNYFHFFFYYLETFSVQYKFNI